MVNGTIRLGRDFDETLFIYVPLEGHLYSEGTIYPGLSAGGALWLLCRVGRLQRAGGGVGRLAGGAWGADHRSRGLRLLHRQRNRRNASWNDDRHSRIISIHRRFPRGEIN